MRSRFLLLLLVGVAGCTTTEPVQSVEPPSAPFSVPGHEGLNATLWVQTSVEYAATTRSIYAMGQYLIDAALADTTWTADLTQRRARGYGKLPPAIIMDVDETVLDNSIYQARLVADDAQYDPASWNTWVQEVLATPVPGVETFIEYANRRGVVVFFVTNRTAELEEYTRLNLNLYDFMTGTPYEDDLLLTRGERPEWDMSDKEPRRAFVRERFRVILYVGDNLGDFVSGENATPEARAAQVQPFERLWGTRWLMLPNPAYGSWEGALYDFDYSMSPDSIRLVKYGKLNTLRDSTAQQPE